MSSLPPSSDRLFNNADSFAQSFDAAWQRHSRLHPRHDLDADTKIALILEQISDHPFVLSTPEQARQVAAFRVRLLGL